MFPADDNRGKISFPWCVFMMTCLPSVQYRCIFYYYSDKQKFILNVLSICMYRICILIAVFLVILKVTYYLFKYTYYHIWCASTKKSHCYSNKLWLIRSFIAKFSHHLVKWNNWTISHLKQLRGKKKNALHIVLIKNNIVCF